MAPIYYTEPEVNPAYFARMAVQPWSVGVPSQMIAHGTANARINESDDWW